MRARFPEFEMNGKQLLNKCNTLRKSYKYMNSEKVPSLSDFSQKMTNRYQIMALIDQEFDQSATDEEPLESEVKAEPDENSPLVNFISDFSSIDDLEANDIHNSLDQPELVEHDYVIKHLVDDAAQEITISTSNEEYFDTNSVTSDTLYTEETDQPTSKYSGTEILDVVDIPIAGNSSENIIFTTSSPIASLCSTDVTPGNSLHGILSTVAKDSKVKSHPSPSHNVILYGKDLGSYILSPLNVTVDKTISSDSSAFSTCSLSSPAIDAQTDNVVDSSSYISTSIPAFNSSIHMSSDIKTTTSPCTSHSSPVLCSSTVPLDSHSSQKLKYLSCRSSPVASPVTFKGNVTNVTKELYSSAMANSSLSLVNSKFSKPSNKTFSSFPSILNPIPCSSSQSVQSISSDIISKTTSNPFKVIIQNTTSSNDPQSPASAYDNLPSECVPSVSVSSCSDDSTSSYPGTCINSQPIVSSVPVSKLTTSTSSVSTPFSMNSSSFVTQIGSSVTSVYPVSSKITSSTHFSKNQPTFMSQQPVRNRSLKKFKSIASNTLPPLRRSVAINTVPVSQRSIGVATLECISQRRISTNKNIAENKIKAATRLTETHAATGSPSTTNQNCTTTQTVTTSTHTRKFPDLHSGKKLVGSSSLSSAMCNATCGNSPLVPFCEKSMNGKGLIFLHSNCSTKSLASSSSVGQKGQKRQRSVSPDCSLSSGNDINKDCTVVENAEKSLLLCGKQEDSQEKGATMFMKVKPNASSLQVPEVSPNVTISPNRDLQAAIVAGDDADSLTTEEVEFVQVQLICILKEALLKPDGPELRFQSSHVIEPGWLLCTCQNSTSLEWLLALEPINGPGGRLLRVIQAEDLPWPTRIGFLVNSSNADTSAVLSLLELQNKKLKVSKWKLIDKKEKNKGTFFTFLIDPVTEKAMEEYQWSLCYEFSTITIHCLGQAAQKHSL